MDRHFDIKLDRYFSKAMFLCTKIEGFINCFTFHQGIVNAPFTTALGVPISKAILQPCISRFYLPSDGEYKFVADQTIHVV